VVHLKRPKKEGPRTKEEHHKKLGQAKGVKKGASTAARATNRRDGAGQKRQFLYFPLLGYQEGFGKENAFNPGRSSQRTICKKTGGGNLTD